MTLGTATGPLLIVTVTVVFWSTDSPAAGLGSNTPPWGSSDPLLTNSGVSLALRSRLRASSWVAPTRKGTSTCGSPDETTRWIDVPGSTYWSLFGSWSMTSPDAAVSSGWKSGASTVNPASP